mmetsp:Transcript_37231/g.91651  ORF Transcript_37231/g.91651 Transcript_37231/m.91651 type:complete len:217 (-) Transcript_37231:699-1349(-)
MKKACHSVSSNSGFQDASCFSMSSHILCPARHAPPACAAWSRGCTGSWSPHVHSSGHSLLHFLALIKNMASLPTIEQIFEHASGGPASAPPATAPPTAAAFLPRFGATSSRETGAGAPPEPRVARLGGGSEGPTSSSASPPPSAASRARWRLRSSAAALLRGFWAASRWATMALPFCDGPPFVLELRCLAYFITLGVTLMWDSCSSRSIHGSASRW